MIRALKAAVERVPLEMPVLAVFMSGRDVRRWCAKSRAADPGVQLSR